MDSVALAPLPTSAHTPTPSSPSPATVPFVFSFESLTNSNSTTTTNHSSLLTPDHQLIWTSTLTPPLSCDANTNSSPAYSYSLFDMLGSTFSSEGCVGDVGIPTLCSSGDSHAEAVHPQHETSSPVEGYPPTTSSPPSSTVSSPSQPPPCILQTTIDPALLQMDNKASLSISYTGGTKRSAVDEEDDFLNGGEVYKKAKFDSEPTPNHTTTTITLDPAPIMYPTSTSCSPLILRFTHRPAIHSPLTPFTYSSSDFTPPPRRPRRAELGLIKFALDPWLRLSRTLETIGSLPPPTASHSADTESPSSLPPLSHESHQPFNPATFPSTGNLRELRKQATPRSCYIPFPPPGLEHVAVGREGSRAMVDA